MSILQVAGEDIDFGGSGVSVDTTSGRFRSGFARCDINGGTTYRPSTTFQGGGVTSCWFYCYYEWNNSGTTSNLWVGLIDSTNFPNGIWIGNDSSDATRVSVYTYNGTTKTRLLQGNQTGLYPGNAATLHRIDVQLQNYGATSTITLYVDGVLNGVFSGSSAISGTTSLNAIGLGPSSGNSSGASEMVVSSTDTRAFSLFTMAPTGAGNTDSWSGTYTGVNGTSYSDANPVYTNVATQNEDFTLTSPPSGSFSIAAVVRNFRGAKTSGSTTNDISGGFYIGSTHYTGTAQAMATSFALYQQFYATNPATSVAWLYSALTGLEANLGSS